MPWADIGNNVDNSARDADETLCVSKMFNNQDFGYLKITVERPLRLNFTVTNERLRRAQRTGAMANLLLSRKRKNKAAAEAEIVAGRQAQASVLKVLRGMRAAFARGRLVKDRAEFDQMLSQAFKAADYELEAALKAALLAPGSLVREGS